MVLREPLALEPLSVARARLGRYLGTLLHRKEGSKVLWKHISLSSYVIQKLS